jgi:hypothetical protein
MNVLLVGQLSMDKHHQSLFQGLFSTPSGKSTSAVCFCKKKSFRIHIAKVQCLKSGPKQIMQIYWNLTNKFLEEQLYKIKPSDSN